MAKKEKRNYGGEDEAMLSRAQTIHNALVNDQLAFTAKFPWMNEAYTTALQTSITAARALPLDSEVVDQQRVLTQMANAQVILGSNALSIFNDYVELTYEKGDARRDVFGKKKWEEARSDQEKMTDALEQAYRVVNSDELPYKAEVMATGFTQAQIDQLATIATTLEANNDAQEDAKVDRRVTTQNRIKVYNSVYKQLQTINKASQVVYRNDAGKLEQYYLTDGSSPTTTVQITVVDAGQLGIANASVQITNTELATRPTDQDGTATFQSSNMPDLIDVLLTDAEGNTATYEQLSVTPETTTEFVLQLPKAE